MHTVPLQNQLSVCMSSWQVSNRGKVNDLKFVVMVHDDFSVPLCLDKHTPLPNDIFSCKVSVGETMAS